MHVGLDGAATQDAVEWWTELREAAREAIAGADADRDELHAVAITGQWASSVPVGADGEPVGEVLLWADTRARDLAREVIGGPVSIGGFAPHKVLPFIRITGGAPTPERRRPHRPLAAAAASGCPRSTRRPTVILEPVDYLGLRFTGRAAATPASMIASWLTDNRLGAPLGYVDSLVTRTRRDRARLPELHAHRLGARPAAARGRRPSSASRPGRPWSAASPTCTPPWWARARSRPTRPTSPISTTSWIGARVPFKRTDILHSDRDRARASTRRTRSWPTTRRPAGRRCTGCASRSSRRTTACSAAAAASARAARPPRRSRPRSTTSCGLAASAPAGCEGLLFMPWLNGERSPVEDKLVRAGWLNLSLRTDRAMLVRSVLEGVAYNSRWLFDAYEKFLKRPVPKVRILGGGAQSDLWCQIYADVLARPVEQVADPRNAQLRGVALWARICLGELTLDQVPALAPAAASFTPSAARRRLLATATPSTASSTAGSRGSTTG